MVAQLEKGSNIENFNKHSTKIATKKKIEKLEDFREFRQLSGLSETTTKPST